MSNLPEDERAMLLGQLIARAIGDDSEEDDDDEDDDDDDPRVQCPVCSKFHEPKEEQAPEGSPPPSASHGCLVVYISHHCPICLEDPAGPPMIAMPCGHLVCQPDFEKLGGYLGERPSDRPSVDHRREARERARVERNRERERAGTFISGLEMMRMIGMPFPPGFEDDDYDEEEEDDDDEDDDEDDESCPPLERVDRTGGNNNNNTNDEDDSDGSMPSLEPVRRRGRGGDNNNTDDDSDDDSMPALQGMNGVEESSDDDDDDSMPELLQREAESSSSDDDDDMPPLERRATTAARRTAGINATTRTGNNRNAVDNDDDVTMPPLISGERRSSDACPSLECVDIESSLDGDSGLSGRGGASVGDSQTDDGASPPPAVETVVVEDTDEENDISGVDDDEDEEEIPFPVLERVRTSSRNAPTTRTFTREEYMALPEEQRDFGPGGAWIMIPSAHHDDYSTLVYTNLDKCVHIGVFPRESRLVVNNKESILICAPKKDSNVSDIFLVNLAASERLYEIPSNAQCVSDGEGGVWALTPTGGTKELSYYDADNPGGSVQHSLPESSYIVMDPLGGLWAHVRKKGTGDMEPGLYYFALFMGHNLISTINQDAKCSPGADGVCVLTNVGGQAQLSNVCLGETARPVTLRNCAASKDIRVFAREKDEEDSCLYVHCRLQNRWKLCLLDDSGRLSDICDCPRDARVVGDGKGGAWIFQRTGASHQMRMLKYVTPNIGASRDHGLSFPPGSKIAGV